MASTPSAEPPPSARQASRPDFQSVHGRGRVRTPTILQMEAVECGAAALAIILGYHGRSVPLEELRVACGVSRDGSNAAKISRAAATYGLSSKIREQVSLPELATLPGPLVLSWNCNHFVVLEGFAKGKVFLNDPATGPQAVTAQEFIENFSGTALVLQPGPEFKKGGEKTNLLRSLAKRAHGSESALLYVVLVSIALVVPGLIIPVFARIFVDEFLVLGATDWVRPLLLGMALTAVLRAALTWMQQHYLLRLETRLALSSSSHFLWHVLRLPVVFFTQRYSGEIGSRVGINDQLARLLSGQLANTILGLLTLVLYAVVMLQYNVMLTALACGIALLNLVVLSFVSRRRKDANQHLLQEKGKLLGSTMAGLQMVETLKATGAETDFFARWAGFQAQAINAQQKLGLSTQFLNVVPIVLTALNNAAVLGVGGLLVIDGHMTIGMLVAFQSLLASFVLPINDFVALGGNLQIIEGGLARLDDVLAHPLDPQTALPAAASEPRSTLFKLNGRIELRHVTFGYCKLDPPLIENFSLTINPGERIALVGSTGCGKSTVSRLVCGFYDPWEGEILFDGQPRCSIPRSALASSLALVDQEIFLFEGTIRENLSLWDTTAPEANIVLAAKDAAIHDEIAERPGGYDSAVEEGGRNFSGGQRQRIEIARALVNNPAIVVLDEATSALDPVTEKTIDQNLRRRGCACLIIAHRLSTVRDCDEIIVMDRGKIVQRGTHSQLCAAPGPYAQLVQE